VNKEVMSVLIAITFLEQMYGQANAALPLKFDHDQSVTLKGRKE
jgi:hypothetical protein